MVVIKKVQVTPLKNVTLFIRNLQNPTFKVRNLYLMNGPGKYHWSQKWEEITFVEPQSSTNGGLLQQHTA